jgi:hypothetical protein
VFIGNLSGLFFFVFFFSASRANKLGLPKKKRRFNNHLKADTGSKLHVFLSLVGLVSFKFSIVEVCTPEE